MPFSKSSKKTSASWWLGAAFLLHVLPFASRPALVGGDEVHYALMAHSIAVDGDFDLRDDYDEVAAGSRAAGRKRAGQILEPHLRRVGAREISTHSVGLPLIASPLIFVQSAIAPRAAPDLPLLGFTLVVTFSALVSGWKALSSWMGDRTSLAAALAFGGYFSSPLWFYSRTFFAEPFVWSFAVLGVAALARNRVLRSTLFLGLAVLSKETAVLLVGPIFLCASSLRGLRKTAPLALGPVLAAGFFVVKNLAQGLPPFTTGQEFKVGDFSQGLLGVLLDSRHGLIVFAAFLVLAAALGVAARSRRSPASPIEWYCGLVVGSCFVVNAAWLDWTGGACFGPRLLLPMLPALAVLASSNSEPRLWSRWSLRALETLFVLGFTVSWQAALNPWRAFWGANPKELCADRPLSAGLGAGLALGLVFLFRRENAREAVALEVPRRR